MPEKLVKMCRMTLMGVLLHEESYLRSPRNQIDFFVVIRNEARTHRRRARITTARPQIPRTYKYRAYIGAVHLRILRL